MVYKNKIKQKAYSHKYYIEHKDKFKEYSKKEQEQEKRTNRKMECD
jgi:hypothetical protein